MRKMRQARWSVEKHSLDGVLCHVESVWVRHMGDGVGSGKGGWPV